MSVADLESSFRMAYPPWGCATKWVIRGTGMVLVSPLGVLVGKNVSSTVIFRPWGIIFHST